jgi:hypothetical protein
LAVDNAALALQPTAALAYVAGDAMAADEGAGRCSGGNATSAARKPGVEQKKSRDEWR